MRLLDSYLKQTAIPDWLLSVDISSRLPSSQLLSGSVYYASCGFDGRPVQYCAGFSHSFIYVDYGYTRAQVEAVLRREGAFRGYRLCGCRGIEREELVGPLTWTPLLPKRDQDGDPARYIAEIKPPFALWAIFDRKDDVDASHGPDRFSLIYIGGDGVITYQSLYYSHGSSPNLVAIIQPGYGFGRNWTDFFDHRRIFAQSILASSGEGPDYIMVGGYEN